jgi:bifunctional non-homologous end joining protein LigD
VRIPRTLRADAGVVLTHPDRVLFPETGVTKGEIAAYYESVAEWIVPHLTDRPLTLKLCAPDVEHCRYLRHAGERVPTGVRTIDVQEQRKRGQYMIVDSLPALLALVQRYIIEYHTWQATAAYLEQPDRIVLDLDPGEDVPWPVTVGAARSVRAVLDALKLRSWLKTTGGKGLHVVVPFRPDHEWEPCLGFARGVATLVARQNPELFTISTAHRAARRKQTLIDYLRNARTATAVAAYSVRARATATVSVPLAWDELTATLNPSRWTVRTLPRRLQKLKEDPWRDFWRTPQRLSRTVLAAVESA